MGGTGGDRKSRPADGIDLARSARRFVDVGVAVWIATALVVDPLLAGMPDGHAVELRLVGLAVLALARLGLAAGAAALPTIAAAGAIALAISGAIAGEHPALAGPYVAMPVLWCLLLITFVAPDAPIALRIGVLWLLGYAGAFAAVAGAGAWRGLAGAAAIWAGALALAVVVTRRQWQLHTNLYESRRLGCYRLMLPIGHGGMNDVWLAWDETRRREVALKLLRTPGAAASTRARFAREAEINRLVRSPHTVHIHDHGVSDDGFAYIALEYLRGMDLDALVAGFGPLEPRRAVHLMRQACEGLGAAHACGVVHRDIKPANLHCTDERGAEDHLRILDFGVARRDHDEESSQHGAVIGTPAYMSPEAFRGEPTTPASDVYALGATFYFALTGVPPVDGESPAEFKRAHQFAPIVPPSLRAGVELPRPIEKVILRCLAKAPADRFPDARALAAALDHAARGLEAWTRDEAARWWHQARAGRVRAPTRGPEHTTDVEVGIERRASRHR